MDQQLPDDIVWRKDKVGFEPPQKQWMQNKKIQEMIQESRQKLVKEKILKPEITKKPIQVSSAYDTNTDDWKYLAVAYFI